MDRSLDEIVSERQVCDHGLRQAISAQQLHQVLNLTLEKQTRGARGSRRGGRRNERNDYPRDGVRKV